MTDLCSDSCSDNSEEILFRQVYPTWLEEDGEPSSQAFRPWRDADQGCLSVDRGSLTSAEAAYLLFTGPRPGGFSMESAGVWGLSVQEAGAENVAVKADPLPATDSTPANHAHALLDFGDLPVNVWKQVGRKFKVRARDRGRIFPPR